MRCALIAIVLLSASRVAVGAQGSPGPAGASDHSPVRRDSTYFDFQVDKQASRLADAVPQAPQTQTKSPTLGCGLVFVQFVIDTAGRAALETVKVLKADDPRLVPAALELIPNMRFSAAEIGGRKVRELVQKRLLFGPVGCVPAPGIPSAPSASRAVAS